MKLDWHGNQIPAIVRGKKLHRHRAIVDESRSVAAVFLAQGPPRAWQLSLDAAVLGLVDAFEEDRRGAEEILAVAARKVRSAAGALVDRGAVKVHAVALSLGPDGKVEVASAGSCRAYLARRGEHRRLSSRTATRGLTESFSFLSGTERLEPGDLVILGPSHLFGLAGVAVLARKLHGGEEGDARGVVRALLSLCRSEETGGAAVAARVL